MPALHLQFECKKYCLRAFQIKQTASAPEELIFLPNSIYALKTCGRHRCSRPGRCRCCWGRVVPLFTHLFGPWRRYRLSRHAPNFLPIPVLIASFFYQSRTVQCVISLVLQTTPTRLLARRRCSAPSIWRQSPQSGSGGAPGHS